MAHFNYSGIIIVATNKKEASKIYQEMIAK